MGDSEQAAEDHKKPVRPRRRAVMTLTLIAVNVVVYLAAWVLSYFDISMLYWFGLIPALAIEEPWRIVTSGFMHSMDDPLHIVLNMYSLLVLGNMLEPSVGRVRFLVIYAVSLLGGSAAVIFLSPPTTLTVGASGAIFGLFGAVLAIALWGPPRYRSNLVGSVVLIGINVVLGFVVPGISWQGHLGGLVAGMVTTGLMLGALRVRHRSPHV